MSSALDLEALETALRTQALQVAARFFEAHLNADLSDAQGPCPCRCGTRARYVERRSKRFETALGPIRLERAYFHCADCGEGFCPRDRELGLEGGSVSPALARMMAAAGSATSFQEASQLLQELAGVQTSAKQVERCAEAVGGQVAEYESQQVEPELPGESVPTLYLGMDGTGLPMRASELQGRAGKQRDGSAKTREAKLCTIWSAEGRDKQGHAVRDPDSATYTAAIESAATRDTDGQPSAFAQRVEREARRRCFDQAQRQVVLGDGAKWIWNIVEEFFPDAIQILDRYHAKERLHELSKLVCQDAASALQWAEQRCKELDDGRIEAILAVLKPLAESSQQAQENIAYFQNNRHRMRYAQFHAQGLCSSSGIVEAGCKNVIGARLKRSGMHWSVPGANAIIALRCARLSGRFEDFWEWRAEKQAA